MQPLVCWAAAGGDGGLRGEVDEGEGEDDGRWSREDEQVVLHGHLQLGLGPGAQGGQGPTSVLNFTITTLEYINKDKLFIPDKIYWVSFKFR